MPCSSNFHSSRATGIACGAARAGATSPQDREWAIRQQQLTRQPRQQQQQQHHKQPAASRDDVQQLRASVSVELHQLCTHLQQQNQQQQGVALTGSLQEQAAQVLQLAAGVGDACSSECIAQQQALFTGAFARLARHVCVSCVEQGVLLTQLWGAHAALLGAAMHGSQAAREREAAVHAALAEAAQRHARLQQLQADERVAHRAVTERHASRLEAARVEYEQLKQQHDKVWVCVVCVFGGGGVGG
jgi:hypothetical protein